MWANKNRTRYDQMNMESLTADIVKRGRVWGQQYYVDHEGLPAVEVSLSCFGLTDFATAERSFAFRDWMSKPEYDARVLCALRRLSATLDRMIEQQAERCGGK